VLDLGVLGSVLDPCGGTVNSSSCSRLSDRNVLVGTAVVAAVGADVVCVVDVCVVAIGGVICAIGAVAAVIDGVRVGALKGDNGGLRGCVLIVRGVARRDKGFGILTFLKLVLCAYKLIISVTLVFKFIMLFPIRSIPLCCSVTNCKY
tara:strand:- start:30028 stop:30471 length:444 start_codon:yes stop_codon:yes gene_type:complete